MRTQPHRATRIKNGVSHILPAIGVFMLKIFPRLDLKNNSLRYRNQLEIGIGLYPNNP